MAGRTLNRRALREHGRQRAAASRRIKVVAAKRNAVHWTDDVRVCTGNDSFSVNSPTDQAVITEIETGFGLPGQSRRVTSLSLGAFDAVQDLGSASVAGA